jgi:tetratricopeptide (TPR) repeat protein
MKKENFAEALIDFNDILKLEPQNKVALSNRAVILISNNENEKALVDLTAAAQVTKYSDGAILLNKGVVEYNLDLCAEALVSLSQAENYITNNPKIYELKAKCFLKQEEFEKAILEWTSAIKLQPEKAEYYYLRGFAKQALENYSAALIDYNVSADLNPDNVQCLTNKAFINFELGNSEQAIGDYSTLISKDPQNKHHYFYRSSVWIKLENYEKAVGDLDSAIKIDKSFAEAYFNLATVYSKMKKDDLTCDNLRKALNFGYYKASEFLGIMCK